MLAKIIKNKAIVYLSSRYLTYAIQFLNSLLIALYLGPYYLGVWGAVTLAIQYTQQINFGIPHSISVIASVNKARTQYVQQIVSGGIALLIILSGLVGVAFFLNESLGLNIGSDYGFDKYTLYVIAIAALGYANTLIGNVFRVYGKVYEIAIQQSADPIVTLLAIGLYHGESLSVEILLAAKLLAFLGALIIYLYKAPISFRPIWSWKVFKIIQLKGIHLFVYNTSFEFIVIGMRSLVSGFYTVEKFGYFTFAFSFANAILLILKSVAYLFLPKLLNRLAYASKEEILELLKSVRAVYISTSHLLAHISLCAFPIIPMLFEKYSNSEQVFSLLMLALVLYSNAFGASGLLMAKGKEKVLGAIAFAAFAISIGWGVVMVKAFEVEYYYVITCAIVAYVIFVVGSVYYSMKALEIKLSLWGYISYAFPLPIIIPYITAVAIVLFKVPIYWSIANVVLFLVLNAKNLQQVVKAGMRVVNNENAMDI